MCTILDPRYCCDKNFIILNGNLYCPKKIWSGKLSVNENTIHFLSRSKYQCAQYASNFPVLQSSLRKSIKLDFLDVWVGDLQFWREKSISANPKQKVTNW